MVRMVTAKSQAASFTMMPWGRSINWINRHCRES